MFGRQHGFGEGLHGEHEKDENALLMELDKGLRSTKVGEQCEAIVRFPRLFEKYPFPILINSAFLKLADVFRVGTNYLRLCVLKVTQQSVRHLDKILNIDEFVHRIYVVAHSNDPIARAITLRTLGCAASIISERKNVQHNILKSLDSNDAVEVEAAIYAATHFAEQSKSFATSICDKLAEKIENLKTPVEVKLKIIPIFQYMHRDLDTIGKVRRLSERLLPSYPAWCFVSVTLHTLSQLASRSLVDIPQQVDLLLSYVQTDVRKSVKVLALTDLRLLAKKGPHMWQASHIEVLCRFLLSTPNADLQFATLNVLATLSSTIAVSKFFTFTILESLLEECCVRFCYHLNMKTVSKALQLFTHLTAAATKVSKDRPSQVDSSWSSRVSLALDSILLQPSGQQSTASHGALKCILQSVVTLCRVCPFLANTFIDTLLSTLGTVPVDVAILYCECLSAITSYHSDTLQSHVPDISQILRTTVKSEDANRDKLIVSMVTVLFQAFVGDNLPSETHKLILDVIGSLNCWRGYQVGRQASRYAHHGIAQQIFGSLGTRVSSEHYYFWLSGLKDICQAESHLQGDHTRKVTQFIDKISKAENCYHRGLSALKAAMTPVCLLEFPSTFVQLRTRTLQAFGQVVKVCCSFQTSPPPAIATSLAVSTGQEIHKCGHVIVQLEKCGVEFDELHVKYNQLYCASFDADPATLASLNILQRSCRLMSHVIETILKAVHRTEVAGNKTGSVCSSELDSLPDTQTWMDAFTDVQQMLHKACHAPTDLPLSYHHLSCIEGVAMVLGQVPLCLPRYFFQKLQSTHIKLAISPAQKSPSEPISISHDTFLTLKVEGVIQHGARPGLYRSIGRVQLTVTSEQQSRAQTTSVDGKLHDNPTNHMSQQVAPHNDYFSTQFLLAFPVTGHHEVTVEAAVVDDDDVVWTTGPRDTVAVKSYDEAVHRQKQREYAAQRQQQRAAAAASQAF